MSVSAMWVVALTFLTHHIGDGQDMTAGRRPRAHDSHHSPPPMAPIMTLGCLTAPRVVVQIMFASLQIVTATGSGAARESGPSKVSKMVCPTSLFGLWSRPLAFFKMFFSQIFFARVRRDACTCEFY